MNNYKAFSEHADGCDEYTHNVQKHKVNVIRNVAKRPDHATPGRRIWKRGMKMEVMRGMVPLKVAALMNRGSNQLRLEKTVVKRVEWR